MSNQPFQPVPNFFGGTEYMATNFQKRILPLVPKIRKYKSIVIPGTAPTYYDMINDENGLIFWIHNLIQQFDDDKINIITDPKVIKNIKFIIAVSNFHKEEIVNTLDIPEEKVIVIENAIEPLRYNPEKFINPKQITLVNTSAQDRGLSILLDSLQYINSDIRVEVYNSFNPDFYPDYKPDSRVRFFGITPKATVREALERSHIHAYPSIYDETFCISQVEAMSAGLICITPDLGALPEVSGGHTEMYKFVMTPKYHTKMFARILEKQIARIEQGGWDPTAEIEYANSKYSWESAKQKWIKFHELL